MLRRLIPTILLAAQFLFSPHPSGAQSSMPSNSSCPCTLQGSVANVVSGQPVPRALVKLSSPSPRAVLTDSEGKFQFEGLPAGRVTLAAEKPGFLSLDPSGRWSIVEFQLAPGSPPALLKLLPEGVISGQLSDENGEPLEGFTVTVIFHNHQESSFRRVEQGSAITDDEGKFRIAGLLPGYTYYLEARQTQAPALNATAKSAAPSGYPLVLYPGVNDIASAVPLKALPGRTVQANLSLKREPFVQLSGTVSGYAPQEQVILSLEDFSGKSETSEIDFDAPSGSFHTKWIPTGVYTITAQSSGEIPVDGSPALSAAQSSTRVVIGLKRVPTAAFGSLRVHATSNLVGLHLALQPTVNIPVVLHGLPDTGPENPLSQLLQLALAPKETGLALANPASTGSFRDVAPGRYELYIEPQPNTSYYAESASWGSADLLREDLVLDSSGSVPPIEITVRDDGATLNGKVHLGDIPPPAQVVLLNDKRRKPIFFPVGSDGFSISGLAPGVYSVFAVDSSVDFNYDDPASLARISSKIQEITLAPKQSASINLELAVVGE